MIEGKPEWSGSLAEIAAGILNQPVNLVNVTGLKKQFGFFRLEEPIENELDREQIFKLFLNAFTLNCQETFDIDTFLL